MEDESPIELPDLPESGGPRASRGKGRVRQMLPHSEEAEAGLLSCCMLDPDAYVRCMDSGVTAESFYLPGHRLIFSQIAALHSAGRDVHEFSVLEGLRKAGEDNAAGAVPNIAKLVDTAEHAGYWIQVVRDKEFRRQLARAADEIREKALNGTEFNELLADYAAKLRSLEQAQSFSRERALPLSSFELTRPDGPEVLLGTNRYLERGEGMMLVSSSGMGKSSMQLQAAVCWALGRPFMGIQPNGPLRSLIVQSEDSEGDIAEVWQSIKACMELSEEQVQEVEERVCLVKEKIHRGEAFLTALRGYIHQFPPDLVWLNPLQAYVGADISKNEEIGAFVRSGLNAVNRDEKFAWILVHHTNKPLPAKDQKGQKQWNEEMYEMAGGAELINWARAIMVLKPSPAEGKFLLILAKRGRRAGVVEEVDQGVGKRQEIITRIPLKHADGFIETEDGGRIPRIFWEAASADEVQTAEAGEGSKVPPRLARFPLAEVAKWLPVGYANRGSFSVLSRLIEQNMGIKKGDFAYLRGPMIEAGLLVQCDDGKLYRPED